MAGDEMKIELNAYAFAMVVDIGLIVLIGFSIYWTKSLWPLLGLLFLYSVKK